MTIIAVVALIGVIFMVVAILLFTIVYFLGNLRKKFHLKLAEQFPHAKFIIEGRSFGQQSLGVTQMRGNGTLALTHDALHFQLWIPNRVLNIPLSAITKIDTVRSHLGKATLSQLLKIEFVNESGENDAIAWQINNLDSIKTQIEQAIQSL